MKSKLAKTLQSIANTLDPSLHQPENVVDKPKPKKTFEESQETRSKRRNAQPGLEETATFQALQQPKQYREKLVKEKEDIFNDAQLG